MLPGVQLEFSTFSTQFLSVHEVNGTVSQRDLFIHWIAEIHMRWFFTGAIFLGGLKESKRSIIISCVRDLQ